MQDKSLALAMRSGMRRLASGVCVLSARLDGDEDFAMTVSSVTSVSDSPASLLVCINQLVSKESHLSTPGCRFAINILGSQHQEVSDVCAGRFPNKDRFSVGRWEVREEIPILGDAQAVFLCEADKVSTYGTHHIVVAKISEVIVSADPVDLLVYADGGDGSFHRC